MDLPDLTKTSIAELMQELHEAEKHSPTPPMKQQDIVPTLCAVQQVVRCAWVLLDNTETDSDGHHIDYEDWEKLSEAMDLVDEIAASDPTCSGSGGHAVSMALSGLLVLDKWELDELRLFVAQRCTIYEQYRAIGGLRGGELETADRFDALFKKLERLEA